MRPGGGGKKGAGFEREICKAFSKWLTEGKRDDLFWRTAMSGGRATLQRAKGKTNMAQVGDLCAIDPEGNRLTDNFVIECKKKKNLNLDGFLLTHLGPIPRFWEKLESECVNPKRQPMLVCHQNQMPTLLIVSTGGQILLELDDRDSLVWYIKGDLWVYDFDWMMENCKCPL